jgi:hypothetical protein
LGLLLWGFCFEVFAFGFWLSDVGGFWKGKWIAEGKVLDEGCWRGKMNWSEDCWREKKCWRRIAKRELLASLRAKALRKLKREHGTVEVWGQRL